MTKEYSSASQISNYKDKNMHAPIFTEESTLLLDKQDMEVRRQRMNVRQAIVLISCFINHLIILGLNSSLGVIYVELIRTFDAQRSEAALVQSIYYGFMLCGGILFTNIIKRFGPGMCSFIGIVTIGTGFFLSIFAANITMVIVFVGAIGGLGASIIFLCDYTAIHMAFKTKKRTALALLTISTTVGQFIFPYFTDILLDQFYWKDVLLILSGICLHGLPFCLLIRFSEHLFQETLPEIETSKEIRLAKIARNPIVIFVVIIEVIANIGAFTQLFFIVDLSELRGYERKVGALFSSILGLTNLVGRVIGTVMLALLVNVGATCHYTHGLALFGVAHFIVIYFEDYWAMFGGVVLQGCTCGLLAATSPGIIIEQCGTDAFPIVLALTSVTAGLIDIMGGFFGGLIADSTGGYDIMYYIAAVSAEIGAILTTAKLLSDKLKVSAKKRGQYEIIAETTFTAIPSNSHASGSKAHDFQ